MIREIRDYIAEAVREVDPHLRFDNLYFENEQISSNSIDDYYKLILGPVSPENLDVIKEANFQVTLMIFNISGTDRVEVYDNAYCKALSIYSKIVDQKRIIQNGFIKSIDSPAITPEEVQSGDNAIRMRIELNITVFYATED